MTNDIEFDTKDLKKSLKINLKKTDSSADAVVVEHLLLCTFLTVKHGCGSARLWCCIEATGTENTALKM